MNDRTAAAEGRETSADILRRAAAVLPGGASGSWRAADPTVVARTRGSRIWTTEGREYLDHILAWGSIVLGHSDPRVIEAAMSAAGTSDLTTIGPQRGEVELAELIASVMPSAERVAFCLSGTEATLHAVHIVRARTGRTRLLKFHGSYHGWHDHLAIGVRAAPGSSREPQKYLPESDGIVDTAASQVTVVDWNNAAELKDAFRSHGNELAAVFCEPYVLSYGCVAPQDGFLETLRELCDAHRVPLVFDEVKTAFRHHPGGYQVLCGVVPDLTAFSKSLGNGFAIGGLAGRKELMDGFKMGAADGAVMDGTNNASPYSMAAGLATLRVLMDGGVERLRALGERMRTGLETAIVDTGVEACVAGTGSSWIVYFRSSPPQNYAQALDSDLGRSERFAVELRKRGIAEPLVALGDRRLCLATDENEIDAAVAESRRVLAALK